MNRMYTILVLALLSLLPISLLAQVGVSSGSASYAREHALPEPSRVYPEDFINYRRHGIPTPTEGNALSLSIDGASGLASNGCWAVQVGVAAQHLSNTTTLPPLQLTLVIDVSGSMSGENRLEKVKDGLRALLTKLNPHDNLCVVAFSSNSRVVLPPTRVSQLPSHAQWLDPLRPGGGTDIMAGLYDGLAQAKRMFSQAGPNRVILLTDGISAISQTALDSVQIASQQGIDLTTVGVGSNVEFEALRNLAQAGRGLSHFVSNSEDIRKLFVNEYESLVAPVARRVTLRVRPTGGTVAHQFGYATHTRDTLGWREVALDDIHYSATQVLILELGTAATGLEAEVTYTDEATGRPVTLRANWAASRTAQPSEDLTLNYRIASLSQQYLSVCQHYHTAKSSPNGNQNLAHQELETALRNVKAYWGNNIPADATIITDRLNDVQAELGTMARHQP